LPDVVVRLKFNYFQRYEPKRSPKGKIIEVWLSDTVDLAIEEVGPGLVPVALRKPFNRSPPVAFAEIACPI
jgi:hypothetical protein